MKKLMLLGLLIGLVSCKGPSGSSGSNGAQGSRGPSGLPGIPGSVMTEWDGTLLAGNNAVSLVGLPAESDVTVYYAFLSLPNVWTELGAPTGTNNGNYPWSAVDLGLKYAYLYNMQAGQLYKIIAVSKN